VDTPDTMQPATSGQPSRRRLFSALGVGSAVTALVAAARPAAAQETPTTAEPMLVSEAPTTTPGAAAGAPSTTTPPRAPQAADLPLLGAAKVLELSAATAWSAAVARLDQLGYGDAAKELIADIERHHTAYAEALSALYGPGSPDAASATVGAKLGADAFGTGDGTAVLAAGVALEQAAADTHLSLLGQIQSTDAASLVASIQIVEARHAAVLAHLQGQPYGADSPAVEDGSHALTAADFAGDK